MAATTAGRGSAGARWSPGGPDRAVRRGGPSSGDLTPADELPGELAELRAALADARGDARAARDEVARLVGENDAIRARLDGTQATAPSATTALPPAITASAATTPRAAISGATAPRERAGARAATGDDGEPRADLEALLAQERSRTAEVLARAEAAARTWRAQVEAAHADAARHAAAARDAAAELARIRPASSNEPLAAGGAQEPSTTATTAPHPSTAAGAAAHSSSAAGAAARSSTVAGAAAHSSGVPGAAAHSSNAGGAGRAPSTEPAGELTDDESTATAADDGAVEHAPLDAEAATEPELAPEPPPESPEDEVD